ncbi:MAG: hypothetical protein GTO54_03935, partial [Nitrososphaeria archaeon]|nr:hypothetical protein [Nitrososphaeria archaeon]
MEVDASEIVPHFNDPIKSITLESRGKGIIIDEGDESDKILKMVEVIKEED